MFFKNHAFGIFILLITVVIFSCLKKTPINSYNHHILEGFSVAGFELFDRDEIKEELKTKYITDDALWNDSDVERYITTIETDWSNISDDVNNYVNSSSNATTAQSEVQDWFNNYAYLKHSLYVTSLRGDNTSSAETAYNDYVIKINQNLGILQQDATTSDNTDYNTNYLSPNNDRVILKTQIVPPVCPACPTLIDGHSHKSLSNEQNGDANTTETDSDSVDNVSINTSSSRTSSGTKQNGKSSTANSNQSDSNETTNKKEEDDETSLLSKIAKMIAANGGKEMPPCPPCARCPEPAFTCEKIVNYRSPLVDNYLPTPVLNDFSNFPSSS
jgi:hypothetical protein